MTIPFGVRKCSSLDDTVYGKFHSFTNSSLWMELSCHFFQEVFPDLIKWCSIYESLEHLQLPWGNCLSYWQFPILRSVTPWDGKVYKSRLDVMLPASRTSSDIQWAPQVTRIEWMRYREGTIFHNWADTKTGHKTPKPGRKNGGQEWPEGCFWCSIHPCPWKYQPLEDMGHGSHFLSKKRESNHPSHQGAIRASPRWLHNNRKTLSKMLQGHWDRQASSRALGWTL